MRPFPKDQDKLMLLRCFFILFGDKIKRRNRPDVKTWLFIKKKGRVSAQNYIAKSSVQLFCASYHQEALFVYL